MERTIFEDEHEHFRESVEGFLRKEAVPRTERWLADGIIDREFWKLAAAQGYVGFAAPEALGGLGIKDFRFNAVVDEAVVATGTVTDAFSLTNNIVVPYLTELCTPEQQERFLPGVTTGEIVPAIAMSEPGAGSDLRAIATTATPTADGYELSGAKTFVTSGIQADLVVVAAQVVRGDKRLPSLFLVPAGTPGFSRGRKLEKIGRRAQDTAELFFEDVPIGADLLIGNEGEGLRYLMRNLSQERLGIAVVAVAHAERGLEITKEYIGERNAFGRPIREFQAIRFALADAVVETRAARAYTDRCILEQTRGTLTAEEAAGLKFLTTDLEFRVLDLCLQLHGGYGYMEEYEISRMWRDSRVQRIYGGTNEIMREIVGRALRV